MTARGSVDEQLVKLEQLRKSPDSPDAVAELTRAIGGKSNVVAGKGAGSVAAGRVASLEGALIAACERFVEPALDKGCVAKLAIVRALEALESRAEDIFFRGSRLVQ